MMINLDTETRRLLVRERQEELRRDAQATPTSEQDRQRKRVSLSRRRRKGLPAAAPQQP
jgi:hypothetical protein